MAILNFNFTKILVERQGKVSKQVNIKSGMNIVDVKESEMIETTKQKAFSISFSFNTNYEPNIGQILLEGNLLYLIDEKSAKEISDFWAKNKSLPQNVALQVFNKILHSCNVEALILSREINLPSPIQLPKIKPVPQAQEKAKTKATKKG